MYIVKLDDDYGSSFYGPFESVDAAMGWVNVNYNIEGIQLIGDRLVVRKENPEIDAFFKEKFYDTYYGKIIELETKISKLLIRRGGH